jgi:hypothetical protein
MAVFFVCVVLAMSSLAQTPPAKQKSAGATGGGATMPGSETWMDIPAAAMVGTPAVEVGGTLKLAILQGDPMTAGRSYVVRLSCTDGAKLAPHWHPTTENVTVIKGGFLLGMGSKWDSASMKPSLSQPRHTAPLKYRKIKISCSVLFGVKVAFLAESSGCRRWEEAIQIIRSFHECEVAAVWG